jgi:Ca2+-transporting ATPase
MVSNKKINNYHQLSNPEFLKQLNVELERGLTAAEIERRQQEYGKNVLTKSKGESPFKLFVGQFKDPMIFILIVAFLLMLVLGEWLEAIVIFIIVLHAAIGN